MLYKIFLIFNCIFFFGCSNSNIKNNDWKDSKNTIYYMDKFQTGDIIIKNKVLKSPLTWFGHVGIMISESEIGEYPKLGTNYQKTNINSWLFDNRKIIILRYNHFDNKFKKVLIKNIKKYNHSKYGIFSSIKNSDKFYCSKFVWLVYSKTIQDLNYDSKLNLKNKIIVLPYDFFNLKDFHKVEFKKSRN